MSEFYLVSITSHFLAELDNSFPLRMFYLEYFLRSVF